MNYMQERLAKRSKPMIGNEETAYIARNVRDAAINFFGGAPAKEEDGLSAYQQYQLLKDDSERNSLENDVLKAKANYYSERATSNSQQKKKMVIGYDDNGPIFYDVPDDTKVLNASYRPTKKPKETEDFESMLNGSGGQGFFNGSALPSRNTVPQHVLGTGAVIAKMKRNPAETLSSSNSFKIGQVVNKNGRNYKIIRLTEDPNDPEVEAV